MAVIRCETCIITLAWIVTFVEMVLFEISFFIEFTIS